MEQLHQVIDENGLQIPLPFLQQYGIQPGVRVTVALGPNEIHVVLPINDPKKIEDLALRLTLKYVGDAAQVKAERDSTVGNQGGWCVHVYGAESTGPFGHLTFSPTGEFLPELSTSFQQIRRNASEALAQP